jgi:uncharacterized SAM-binding protein YcdF (DUF218 family)
MFFVLSKSVSLLLLPSNFLFGLLVLGVVLILFTRWQRSGRVLAAASLIVLIVIGYLPVGRYFIHVLENRFPVWDSARGAPDGIVVLGGVVNPILSRARGQVALDDSAERLTVLAKLARDYPNARIVFTSGDGSLFGNVGAEADYVLPLLESFGIPRARITLENRARNTAENAAFVKALVKPKPGERWLLVTSARHMPRAIGCFRRVGFPVEAYPVDWQTGPRFRFGLMDSFSLGLVRADDAAHEWLGLLFYWLTGRTSEFLPGPMPAPAPAR